MLSTVTWTPALYSCQPTGLSFAVSLIPACSLCSPGEASLLTFHAQDLTGPHALCHVNTITFECTFSLVSDLRAPVVP